MGGLEKQRIKYRNELNEINNKRYNLQIKINSIKSSISEISKDSEYAMELPEEIPCPYCGVIHKNDFYKKIEIISDLNHAKSILSDYRSDLSNLNKEHEKKSESLHEIDREYKRLKIIAKNNADSANVINTYKAEGRNELVKTNQKEMKKLNDEISELLFSIDEKIQIQDKITSEERRKEIREDLKGKIDNLLLQLDVPIKEINLRNFKISVGSFSGSDGPRVIYSYYSALYLYNLERDNYPFKFLVVDTPNQQGQDELNLKNIFDVLSYLTDRSGQVIIGTERLTGYEDISNLIYLENEKRSCLETINYQEHLNLLDKLDSLIVANKLS